MMKLECYDDFTAIILDAGFSMGGGNAEGIFAAVPFGWDNTPPQSKIKWHTGDAETDPWEWRIRVLDERDDIAYAKVFFKKSGFISRDWYPCFLAARRGSTEFDEAYGAGGVSEAAKRIYEIVSQGATPLHAIKVLAGFGKDEKSAFDRAIVELQMKMYITMCGRRQKLNKYGIEYGWASTVFCTVEDFFGAEVFAEAAEMTAEDAAQRITQQVLRLNPDAQAKKISKFIFG